MAAVVESSTTATSASGSSIVLTKPSGLSVGDLMICHYALSDATDTMSTLSGWTHEISNQSAGGTSVKTGLQWKVADSGDVAASNFTFSLTGTSSIPTGALMRISGYIASDLLNDAATLQGNTQGPVYTNTRTPLSTSALLLFFTTAADASPSLAPDVSSWAIVNNNPTWTQVYDIDGDSGGGTYCELSCASAQYTAGTATGNSSASISGSSTADSYGMMVVISAPVSVSSSPSVLEITSSLNAPAITGDANVTGEQLGVTVSVNAPTVSTPTPDWTNGDKTSAPSWTNPDKS
jgi:hypothetical protein